MKAVVESRYGGPDALEITDIPAPKCGPQDVLIEVHAAGLNRADALQRRGKYPVPPGATYVYGLEVSGRVVEIGREAEGYADLKPGDPVMALLASGGYAEMVAVPHEQVMRLPTGLSFVEGAAIPEVAATVWSNLFVTEGLSPEGPTELDEHFVLIHGGSSGIGAHAVQLCRALGYQVFTTVGSEDKAHWVRRLVDGQDSTIRAVGGSQAGGVEIVNYRTQDFVEVVLDKSCQRGVIAILDVVGGRYLGANLNCLARRGHLVTIAVQGGAKGELNLSKLMNKGASITGTTLRNRSVEEKGEILADMAETVVPLLESGAIHPGVDRVFSLGQVREAHEYFESGEHRGKVVLKIR